jgi:hypothetical protein
MMMEVLVKENNTYAKKKVSAVPTNFEAECRRFDSILEQPEDSLYNTAHTNDQDFESYTAAQSVRDFLFVLMRKLRGIIPDPASCKDFDMGSGEVSGTDG